MSKGVNYALSLDASAFSQGTSVASSSLSSLMGSATRAMAGIGAVVASVATAVKSLSVVWEQASASIAEAASRESLSAAFVPLLGSMSAAKERMGELAQFAAATPFQLPQVAAASRILQTLTDGFLATGAGLTMVGDVAAATNRPFDEIATTVGRLYAGLDAGRPVGEVMARLEELGAIAPSVRTRLEALQKEGKKGKEVWAVAAEELAKFTGGMVVQSETWQGKISTLEDAWAELRAAIGAPIMDALKPLLDEGISVVESMAQKAKDIGKIIGDAANFLIEAWKQDSIWSLAQNGLSIAFKEAVNVLWKSMMAVWESLPTFLNETFKGAVMWFEFLTEGKFWSTVADTALNRLQTVASGLMMMLSDGLGKVFSVIPGLEDASEFMQGLSGEFREEMVQNFKDSESAIKELVGDYGQRYIKRALEAKAAMDSALSANYNQTADVFDTSAERKSNAELMLKIDQKLDEKAEEKRKKEEKIVAPKRDKAPVSGQNESQTFQVHWERVFAASLASVGGGGYGSLMLKAEPIAQKQLTEQKKTNDLLDKILNKQKGNLLATFS